MKKCCIWNAGEKRRSCKKFFSHCRLYTVCHSVKNFLIFFHFQLALDCVAALQPLVRIFAIYAVNGFYGAGLLVCWMMYELCVVFAVCVVVCRRLGQSTVPCSALLGTNNARHGTVAWTRRLLTSASVKIAHGQFAQKEVWSSIISLYSTALTYLASNSNSVENAKRLLRRSRSFKVIEVLSSTAGNSRLVTSSGLCSTLNHACTACSLHRAIQILLTDSELPANFQHCMASRTKKYQSFINFGLLNYQ